MGSRKEEAKARFLARIQQSIDHYLPLLEQDFQVRLEDVDARELKLGFWFHSKLEPMRRQMRRECRAKHNRAPGRWREAWFTLQFRFAVIVFWIPLYIRFWLPEFIMQWDRRTASVTIPFFGWFHSDFKKNAAFIEQWTIHEMAHGIWERIAQDNDGDQDSAWRFWNEGFAHYVADIHMQKRYPEDHELCENWSKSRLARRNAVSRVIEEKGTEFLKLIPKQWSQLEDARANGNADNS